MKKNRIEKYIVETIALGFAYFEHISTRKVPNWFDVLFRPVYTSDLLSVVARDVRDFTDHDLSAIKEGGAWLYLIALSLNLK